MTNYLIDHNGLVRDTYDFDPFGDVDEVISRLEEIKKKYPDAVRLTLNEEWIGYEDVEYHLYVHRKPTQGEIKEDELTRKTRMKQLELQRKQEEIDDLERKLRRLKNG